MRTVDLLRLLAPFVMGAGLAVGASRRRVIRHFIEANAFERGSAISPPRRRLLTHWMLGRLESEGVLRSAGSETYWLDRTVWQERTATRRRRALWIVFAVLILGAATVIFATRR